MAQKTGFSAVGTTIHHGKATLASGQATVKMPPGSRWWVLGLANVHATAIPNESLGVAGTPDADGAYRGDALIDSSNDSASSDVVYAFLVW